MNLKKYAIFLFFFYEKFFDIESKVLGKMEFAVTDNRLMELHV